MFGGKVLRALNWAVTWARLLLALAYFGSGFGCPRQWPMSLLPRVGPALEDMVTAIFRVQWEGNFNLSHKLPAMDGELKISHLEFFKLPWNTNQHQFICVKSQFGFSIPDHRSQINTFVEELHATLQGVVAEITKKPNRT